MMAETTILEFHKEGQSRGWSWNTEELFPFSKNASNEIEVPTNVVSWSPDSYEWAGRFQLRGQRVYDTENRTYAITDTTISELKADVTWLLTWDECPEAFNRWVTIRSARVFSDRVLSDD